MHRRAWPALAALPLVLSATGCSHPTVSVPVPTPSNETARLACDNLVAGLPTRLGDARRVRATPRSGFTAAWRGPLTVLQCGVPAPPRPWGAVAEIDGVAWLTEQHGSTVVWRTLDRPVTVQVTITGSTSQEDVMTPLTDVVRDRLSCVRPPSVRAAGFAPCP